VKLLLGADEWTGVRGQPPRRPRAQNWARLDRCLSNEVFVCPTAAWASVTLHWLALRAEPSVCFPSQAASAPPSQIRLSTPPSFFGSQLVDPLVNMPTRVFVQTDFRRRCVGLSFYGDCDLLEPHRAIKLRLKMHSSLNKPNCIRQRLLIYFYVTSKLSISMFVCVELSKRNGLSVNY
jgi:hypothetical protein